MTDQGAGISPKTPTVSAETPCKTLGEWRRRESNPRTTPTVSAELVFVKQGYAARRPLERAIAARDGSWACFYCGRLPATSLDHVTSRYYGGSDGIQNLVLACRACNDEKNTTAGWLFALRKCWEFVWADPFLAPSPALTLTYTFDERRGRDPEAVPSTRGAEAS